MGFHRLFTGPDLHEPSNLAVINNSGGTLTQLKVVKFNGVDGAGKIQVVAVTATTDNFRGLISADILDTAEGLITALGRLNNVDTSSFVVGDILFSDASGDLSTTPSDIRVGEVLKVNATTGVIYVDSKGADGATGAPGGSGDYILLIDEKPNNTKGGTFSSGSFATRNINTEKSDIGNHATISSNQITLQPGTYRCDIVCPAYHVLFHQARLQNVDDATTIAFGTGQFNDDGGGGTSQGNSTIKARFTLAATKVLEIQHRCSFTKLDEGFGRAMNFGNVEVFTIAEFIRE